jgi:hypothetical protein
MRFWFLCLILFLSIVRLPAQVTFNNHLEYSYWEDYKTWDNSKKYKSGILENWTDLTYQYQWLQLGARYEINHPPDPFIFDKAGIYDMKEYDLTYYYARAQYNQFTFTAGNYYATLGRGLALRTYEDRNLRVDNNLRGGKVSFNGSWLNVQALAGQMRDKYNRRRDWLYGVDAEVTPLSGLQIGGSWLYEQETKKHNAQIVASRINYVQDWFDVYAEIVKPQWTERFSSYLAFNFALDKLAITTELKDYNQLTFTNHYETEYNAAPALSREHIFSLLNRHPHQLNMNDEKGYQAEAQYSFTDEMQLLLNHSQTFKTKGEKLFSGERLFSEYYGEWHQTLSERIDYRLAAALNYTTDLRNITPLADGFYNLTDRDQLHASYQHQHTKNLTDQSEFDNELLMVEYTRSPLLSLALVGEYTNKYKLRNVDMNKHTWLYGQASLNFWKNQQVSLLYGSRQEGFICVGGICRYEPEFEGFEFKLTNRF